MSKLFNLTILGSPVNIITIMMMIAVFWFAAYTLKNRGILTSATPSGDDDK